MIIIVLAAIMALVAFVILIRVLWLSKRPSRSSTVVTLAALALITGLAVLAATGRLHWIAALGAALLPFLKRALSLIRYLPVFRGLFGAYQTYGQNRGAGAGGQGAMGSGDMSLDQAREILDLGKDPTRDEIIAAHRRLMQKLHPDRGGSTFLAQQLNEAKRVLMKNAR